MKVMALFSASLLGVVAFSAPAPAQQLVYQPISPTLGGNPLNGTFLLNSALSQGSGVKSGPAGASAASVDLSGLESALGNLGTSLGSLGTTSASVATPITTAPIIIVQPTVTVPAGTTP
jgi:curli production assembly/transport component CsgF